MDKYVESVDFRTAYPIDFTKECELLNNDNFDKYTIFIKIYNKIFLYNSEKIDKNPELYIIPESMLKILHAHINDNMILACCLVDILCLDLEIAKGDIVSLFNEVYDIFEELWCVDSLGGIQIQLLKILELMVSTDRGRDLFFARDPTELFSTIISFCLRPELVPDSTIIIESDADSTMSYNELYRIAALNCLSKLLCPKYPLDFDVANLLEMCKDILLPNSGAQFNLKKSSVLFLSAVYNILPDLFCEDYSSIGNIIYFVNDSMNDDSELLYSACSFLKNVTISENFDYNILYDIGVYDTLILFFFKKYDTQNEIALILQKTKREEAVECIRRMYNNFSGDNKNSCILISTLFNIITQEELVQIVIKNIEQLQVFFDAIEFFSIDQLIIIADAIIHSIQAIYSYDIADGIRIIEENIEQFLETLNKVYEESADIQIKERENKIKTILHIEC